VAAPADAIVRMPDELGFVEAAAVPTSGLIAIQVLVDEATVVPGTRVLINGAGGSVGTFAVQVAAAKGAIVTAVDRGSKLEQLRELGAEQVLDCEASDFTRTGEQWDLIVDVPINHPWSEVRRVVTPNGRYVPIARSVVDRRVAGFAKVRSRVERLEELVALIEAGKLRPLVDRTYPLEQVADAMRYLASEQATGKIVLEVA
jgi:NADPH:quinone reductase-like Zn-dependent oxidoreductase